MLTSTIQHTPEQQEEVRLFERLLASVNYPVRRDGRLYWPLLHGGEVEVEQYNDYTKYPHIVVTHLKGCRFLQFKPYDGVHGVTEFGVTSLTHPDSGPKWWLMDDDENLDRRFSSEARMILQDATLPFTDGHVVKCSVIMEHGCVVSMRLTHDHMSAQLRGCPFITEARHKDQYTKVTQVYLNKMGERVIITHKRQGTDYGLMPKPFALPGKPVSGTTIEANWVHYNIIDNRVMYFTHTICQWAEGKKVSKTQHSSYE